MTRRFRDSSGYSLVEVLAAIVLLSVAIIPMIAMFDSALQATSTSGSYDEARAQANESLETAKARGFTWTVGEYPPDDGASERCEGFSSGGNLDSCEVETTYVWVDTSTSPAEFKQSDSDDPRDMVKVTVTVEWDGDDSEYSTAGVIAE